MKKTSILSIILSALALAAGIVGTALTRGAAIAEGAAASSKMYLALCLIVAIAGLVSLVKSLKPRQHTYDIRTLVFAAMFAALCYIGFAYLKIDIPVGTSSTAFHLGNVFVVIAALFLGGYWGGMAGAVGLSIADLTTQYVTSAPKTFLLKLCIGLITGFVAHRILRLPESNDSKPVLAAKTALAAAAGMGFNVVADPIVGYFYKQYLLGVPQDAAKLMAKIGAVTTLVNAIIAVVVATIFYLALRRPMQQIGVRPEN